MDKEKEKGLSQQASSRNVGTEKNIQDNKVNLNEKFKKQHEDAVDLLKKRKSELDEMGYMA